MSLALWLVHKTDEARRSELYEAYVMKMAEAETVLREGLAEMDKEIRQR